MTEEKTKMNILLLVSVALLTLAVVVLMGGAIIGAFSEVLRIDTSVDDVQFILPFNGSSVNVGTTGQYPFLQSVTDPCTDPSNSSISYDIGNYTVNEGNANGGSVFLTAGIPDVNQNQSVNCTISYLADSTAQGTADTFSAGLSIFGTFAAILALAIIGKFIIGFFNVKRE